MDFLPNILRNIMLTAMGKLFLFISSFTTSEMMFDPKQPKQLIIFLNEFDQKLYQEALKKDEETKKIVESCVVSEKTDPDSHMKLITINFKDLD